jgi:hypothetical protein
MWLIEKQVNRGELSGSLETPPTFMPEKFPFLVYLKGLEKARSAITMNE